MECLFVAAPYLIRACLIAAVLVHLGCASTQGPRDQYASTPKQLPPSLPPGVHAASPIAPHIRGAGIEMIVVTLDASAPDIHEAIVAAGGQRDTTTAEWARGLEVITLDSAVLDPLLRSLHPSSTPRVTWLGIPVRWSTAIKTSGCALHVRGWPLSMESGEAAVVDVRLDMPDGCRRERLLLPNQALLMVPGGPQFPLPMGAQVTPGPVSGLMVGSGVTVVAFRPRFHKSGDG